MWRFQEVWLGTHEVNREVFFQEKPSVFLLCDHTPDEEVRSNIWHYGYFERGSVAWCLEKIEPLYVPAEPYWEEKWAEFSEIMESITYKPGWYFRTGVEKGRMWVQVGVTDEAEISFDPIAGDKVPWRGAKHYLSPHMCRQEIVSTVLHAIERAEMHEVREWFRYKGRSIYNPHLDPDALVEVAKFARNFNTREYAMTMSEG